MFVLAYPFLYLRYSVAIFPWPNWRPGAWQSYYDAVFPVAPLVVGGVVYGLLHPAESLLSRVMRMDFCIELAR